MNPLSLALLASLALDAPRLHVDPAAAGARVLVVEPVRQRTVAESVVTLGRVERDDLGLKPVTSRVSGRLLRVMVAPGTHVHAGQPLAELASQDVEAARSAAIQAESDLDSARRALETLQFNASSVSSRDIDGARADLRRAQSQVDQTKKTLAGLGVDPRSFTSLFVVHSPWEGTVLDVLASSGSELRQGDRLLRLGDPHHWVVTFQARAKDRGVQPGEPVDLSVEGHPEPLHGKVRQVSPAEAPGTVQAVVAVEDSGSLLKPGLEVQVKLGHAATSQILSVPASAILFVEGGAAVVVAQGSLDLELRRVEIGPIEGASVRVVSGLEAGESVLVQGAPFARAAIEGR